MERWPERHNVLMIPWVSLSAGPEAVPPERVDTGNLGVSHGFSNAIRKQEIEEHWHWKLQVRPVTVMVDDVQLGCELAQTQIEVAKLEHQLEMQQKDMEMERREIEIERREAALQRREQEVQLRLAQLEPERSQWQMEAAAEPETAPQD
eukprot:s522_g17.t1